MGDKGFTKTDMERVGIFQEMNYITIQDKYKGAGAVQFNQAASKGKQMIPEGTKSRSALQAGYFSDKFNRVMEGEAYSDPIKLRRQHRLSEKDRNLVPKPFLPSSGEKQPSGLGNHYGTLGGPISAFSPGAKPRKQYKEPGKNFYTNPGKRGTGFGYLSVTIGGYHKHQPDEYERAKDVTRKECKQHTASLKGGAFKLNMAPKAFFDENPYRGDRPIPPPRKPGGMSDLKPFKPSSPGKVPAGMKAGTFDPYPSHSVDPFKSKMSRPMNVVNKTGKIFMPSAGPRSAPVSSILNQNVVKSINSGNYKTTTTVMSY